MSTDTTRPPTQPVVIPAYDDGTVANLKPVTESNSIKAAIAGMALATTVGHRHPALQVAAAAGMVAAAQTLPGPTFGDATYEAPDGTLVKEAKWHPWNGDRAVRCFFGALLPIVTPIILTPSFIQNGAGWTLGFIFAGIFGLPVAFMIPYSIMRTNKKAVMTGWGILFALFAAGGAALGAREEQREQAQREQQWRNDVANQVAQQLRQQQPQPGQQQTWNPLDYQSPYRGQR